ncbi:MAG: glycosyltransferase [Planctomycetota bacterium]
MRILQVVHGFPPYDSAGTEVYTFNISRRLAREHEVFVFSRRSDHEKPDYEILEEQREGLDITFLNNNDLDYSRLETTYRSRRAEQIFADYLDRVKPDILHVQHLLGLSIGLISVAKRRGIPVVFTFPDFWFMCSLGQRLRSQKDLCHEIDHDLCFRCVFHKPIFFPRHRFAANFRHQQWKRKGSRLLQAPVSLAGAVWNTAREKRLHQAFTLREAVFRAELMQVDQFIAPSEFIRQEYIRHVGLPPEQILYSDYGMDLELLRRDSPPVPGGRIRFGYMGTLIPSKGVDVIIKAFNQLPDDVPAEVNIFGGPNRWTQDYFESLKAEATHPGIHFRGRYMNTEISKTLDQIDVLIVPSLWFENSPLTLHEAAAARIPVITSDIGGMKEFVDRHRNGRTFRVGDPEDLRLRLEELLTEPSLIQELGDKDIYIKNVAENAEELLEIYERLRGEAKSRNGRAIAAAPSTS